jgi:predicted unusual protein kinase regulating ubiquinone biosynthesis (AarF/ABC1/UbiB family)
MLHLLPIWCTALVGGPATPYPGGVYDSESARAYFSRRPLSLTTRALEIGWRSASFGGTLLQDVLSGDGLDGPRAAARGRALTDLLVELGPAFIKLGQSASVRTDLLPPAYVKSLTSLQEDVPAFSSAEAREIISSELGSCVAPALLAHLSPEPIAAASLGQVYKAELDGSPVAVKVQRPAITERIALDMLLVREVVAPLASLFGAPGDIAGIADTWGTGLVEETDYLTEATNAEEFNAQLAGGSLEGRVFAPSVVREATSRRVLTTEWVDGERLDQTEAADDVPRLASLAMNCYMNMMLEEGNLHCDPHPGNLLRTPDGRLCILDWGLVSRLEPGLRLSLIEHVAHLVARDYAKVPSDLVKLGFVPAGQEAAAQDSGAVDLLTYAYSKRAEGGGFSNFDVPALFDELSADAGSSIFQIPPYFAYIAKAFATLEGIGLSADPQYSILNETLPYIARRILTDPSPRTAGALQTFVFGEAKDDKAARVLDADRVFTLVDGVRRYADAAAIIDDDGASTSGKASSTAAAAAAAPQSSAASSLLGPVQLSAEVAADALLNLLAEDTPASRIVTEQLVLVLAASSRQLWSELRERSGTLPGSASTDAQASSGGSDGSARPRSVLGTLVDPLGLFRRSTLTQVDERDRAALDAAAQLAAIARDLVGPDEGGAGGAGGGLLDQQQLVRTLASKALERREDVWRATRRLAVEALDQTSERLRASSGTAA